MLNKLIKVFIYFVLSSLLLISCINSKEYCDYELKILSPKSDWIYTTDLSIIFSCNISADNLIWSSSIDGIIGNTNEFSKKLSAGNHKITVKDPLTNQDTCVFIKVTEKENKNGLKLITNFPFIVENNLETEKAAIISIDGSVNNLQIKVDNNLAENNLKLEKINRDIVLQNEVVKLKPVIKKKSRNALVSINTDKKKYYVIDTNNSTNVHEINAKKYYKGDIITVWFPENFEIDKNLIDDLIQKLENCVLKRVQELWGECTDINQDKTISILFTPTINEEKVAIGFFNSKDFFINIKDIKSDSYNPYSNEEDIIYVAIPDENDSNYQINSIIATIAHEYAHAINFTTKTWKKIINNENFQNEDTFLDEGWSHLTETLCGYGISGGNISFVNYFLEDMALYSFCKNDYLGRDDSVGKRGAICMFLYWLFNKAGGFEYSLNNINYIDKGGISFLRSMNNSSIYGWESIGEYFKKSTDSLFLEFSQELLLKNTCNLFDQNLIDPYTKENIFKCNEINFSLKKQINKILPYSINILSLLQNDCYLDCDKFKGTMYYFIFKKYNNF